MTSSSHAKPIRQNRFRKDIELCMISLDGGSNVVHDSPPTETGRIMNTYTWYQTLIKPLWAPPSWLFGPVWMVLYAIIAVSFGAVFYKAFTKQIPRMVALPFTLNLLFNFAFTPLQFGLKNNLLASIDIVLVLGTLVWALWSLWHASSDLRWAVYANLPYLLWVSFATVLQLTITFLNQ